MKKILLSAILMACALVGVGVILPSCDDGNGYTPSGNYFYDRNLIGDWALYQVNGSTVGGSQVNYLTFSGGGNGYYYYYQNGFPYSERISYACAYGYNTDSITIRYADGQTSTMNYWFSNGGRSLWMSWNTYSGTYTYQYRLTYSIPF